MASVNLDLWKIDQLKGKEFFLALLLAESGKGKTSFAKYIIENLTDEFDSVFVFIGSSIGVNNNYSDVVPFENIIEIKPETDKVQVLDVIKSLLDALAELYKRANEDILAGNDIKPPKFLFVFDDLSKNTGFLVNIINVCRHSNVSVLLLAHNGATVHSDIKHSFQTYFFHIQAQNLDRMYSTKKIKEFNTYAKTLDPVKRPRAFIVFSNGEPTAWKELSKEEIKTKNNTTFKFWGKNRIQLKSSLESLGNKLLNDERKKNIQDYEK